ncbi:MAG: adenine phosphoribosyltransferase [Kiritimatiellia bacterium]
MTIDDLRAAVRDIPDFPKPGILFKDITPILQDPVLFKYAMGLFADQIKDRGVTKVAAVDARGFFFGGVLCERLGIGLVPIRKAGKLPYKTHEVSYELEYGTATLAIHQDAFIPGDRVVLVDDLLATGGTAAASAELIRKAGGELVQIQFLIELAFLEGRRQLAGYEVYAPIVYT